MRVVDVFVDELDLVNLRFEGVIPADAGRPAYHPSVLLKIYIYGYLNRIQHFHAIGATTRARAVSVPARMSMGSVASQMKSMRIIAAGLAGKLNGVSAEMSVNVLAYNLKRVMKIIGTTGLMKALAA